ncbi:MAG: ABC transporter permease [Methyloligellaceae bacterium]
MSDELTWINHLSFGDTGWGDELLFGALTTLQLALAASIAGVLFGIILAGMKLSSWRILSWSSQGYITLIRGTPEFLVMLIVFFGLSDAVFAISNALQLGIEVDIPKFLAAFVGLAMIFGAYSAEVFRGAYLSIPKGQFEAAKALGLTPFQSFRTVILPQVWRYAVPGLGNLWMVLLKDTSLAAVIAFDELLRVSKVASETTRDPLTFYLAAGIIYLAMTGLSDIGRHYLERSARRGIS